MENSPQEIYEFHDGKRKRFADPVMVDLRFREACSGIVVEDVHKNFFGPEWLLWERNEEGFPINPETGKPDKTVHEGAYRQALDFRNDAIGQILPPLYTAFNCNPLDEYTGEGTVAENMISIYTDYLLFKAGVKKNIDSSSESPLSGPESIPSDSETSTSPATPITNSSLPSTSHRNVPSDSRLSPPPAGLGPR